MNGDYALISFLRLFSENSNKAVTAATIIAAIAKRIGTILLPDSVFDTGAVVGKGEGKGGKVELGNEVG